MSSRCRRWLVAALFVTAVVPAAARANDLRVCADPDNLPFSNSQQKGFENQIARLVARELHVRLIYVWQRMGRGFVREYLNTTKCDLLIGVPVEFSEVLATRPYYRSSYVFVVRRDATLKPGSLNDDNLRGVRIGVQALDEEYTPPAEALARRGMQTDIVGFHSIGPDPGKIVRAVVDREVGAAIVWGPLAGYFARPYGDLLQLTPISPEADPPGLLFTFMIGMGVRKGNTQLRDALNAVLARRQPQIARILASYGVPQLDLSVARDLGD
jgi:mxaJ protein